MVRTNHQLVGPSSSEDGDFHLIWAQFFWGDMGFCKRSSISWFILLILVKMRCFFFLPSFLLSQMSLDFQVGLKLIL